MPKIIEHHRVPLGPQFTLIYQRQESQRSPLSVDCSFRMGYADGDPGQIYALMKAFQGQYAPAWRPRLTLTPDWSQLSFQAAPEYRRALDEQWLQLFELESALTELEPLKNGLLQEQRLLQESMARRLDQSFQSFAFAGTAYGRPPLGLPEQLAELGQEDLLDAYLQLFTNAQVYLRIRDHQPLPQVLDRIRPLLSRQSTEIYRPEPLLEHSDTQTLLTGPREQSLRLKVEGSWLDLGFVLPGMDNPNWIYGPLLKAWLEDVWRTEAPSDQLQLVEARWQPWQRASLLSFRMHSHQVTEIQELKLRLVRWLVQARQGYLTSRRLKQAIQQAAQVWSEDRPPLYAQIDEWLEGWGHGRARLLQVSQNAFQQAVNRYLNADAWVLQEVYSPAASVRQYPEHLKEMGLLGVAPRPKTAAGVPAGSTRYSEIQRLHLSPNWSMWVVPQAGAAHLEIGVWFASGSAGDIVPGTSRLLMELLGQRFGQLLELNEDKGALRQQQSWQTGVTRDFCFFRWATGWSELPQALKILHGLLQDLPLDHQTLTQLKSRWQAKLQYCQLDPAWRAAEQFALSGFANHPYAFGSDGTYLSLQQMGLETFRQRWRELRQSALTNPLLMGNVPSFLDADMIAPAFDAILASTGAVSALPPAKVRRGEIAASAEPKGYRLEGQIFTGPLALDQHGLLALSLQWMQDQLRSQYALPLEVRCETLSQAWYFAFAGLYGKDERQRWLQDARQISEPLDMLKQRLIADRRSRHQNPGHHWQELVCWLNLGGSPASFGEREHQILTLRREDVEAFITHTLTRDNDWLQVVFQGLEERQPSRRY